ncbi:MAG: DUF3137 domain-containing protein [Epsilonproteobacteria bacterium]|nr:DUF3137 domain-containing protein [Campylobacterota bacterium]
MKSTSELTDFYYSELYPTILELEKKRKTILSKIEVHGFAGLVIFIVLALMIIKNFGAHSLFSILVIITMAIVSLYYNFLTSGYNKEFKELIISPIINAINQNLEYDQEFFVSQYIFERSDLFTHSIDKYSGNDHVRGIVDGVDIEFSNIHAQYKTRDSKGREHYQTLFHGIFFIAKFNKNFKSKIIVLPDIAQRTFGSLLGGWLQANNFSRDKMIKMDNPEFEKQFVVYGSDPIETNYILSHSVMQRILDFQKKISYPLFISFVHNYIHIAIDTKKDLFAPNIFKSLLDFNQTADYINSIRNMIMIVDELKLNEKLWGKI